MKAYTALGATSMFKKPFQAKLNVLAYMMLSFGFSEAHSAENTAASAETAAPSNSTATIKPASAEACVGLESNADRLACYDAFFKIPESQLPAAQARADAQVVPATSSKLAASTTSKNSSLPEQVSQTVSNLSVVSDAPPITPNLSLLDKNWELSKDSKLGTWNIRSYQPVYALPVFWTSDKNETPSSPNPNNTVTTPLPLDSTEAKFQLSFKTKAWENIIGDNGDLWLGYTQSSRWQVFNAEESRPFRETNYEPEAMMIFRTNYRILGLDARLLGVGVNHQSNGRSDPLSRSWNRVMFNAGFERGNFALMLRPWLRISENSADDNNANIEDYVGRGDLTAFYRHKQNDFSLMLRHSLKGGDKSRGAVQFDWAFPISGKLRGHFQVFDGYGESLIDYNHKATYVGLGVSLLNWY